MMHSERILIYISTAENLYEKCVSLYSIRLYSAISIF